MNPVEYLWDQLKKAIYSRVTDNTTLAHLSAIAQQEWQRIPMWRVHRLIRSMTRRAAECWRKNDGHTRYWKILKDNWCIENHWRDIVSLTVIACCYCFFVIKWLLFLFSLLCNCQMKLKVYHCWVYSLVMFTWYTAVTKEGEGVCVFEVFGWCVFWVHYDFIGFIQTGIE